MPIKNFGEIDRFSRKYLYSKLIQEKTENLKRSLNSKGIQSAGKNQFITLSAQILIFEYILHQKELGLLGEMAVSRAGAGKVQDDTEISHFANRNY